MSRHRIVTTRPMFVFKITETDFELLPFYLSRQMILNSEILRPTNSRWTTKGGSGRSWRCRRARLPRPCRVDPQRRNRPRPRTSERKDGHGNALLVKSKQCQTILSRRNAFVVAMLLLSQRFCRHGGPTLGTATMSAFPRRPSSTRRLQATRFWLTGGRIIICINNSLNIR